jgi:hypothetical protein
MKEKVHSNLALKDPAKVNLAPLASSEYVDQQLCTTASDISLTQAVSA